MGLPGLNQYLARIKLSCSKTQHSDAGEAQTIWASTEFLVFIASASREHSDKPVHMHSLAKAFAAHIHEVWM